jgi:hypothetical protein
MKVRISLAAFVMAVMWQVVGLSAAFSGSLLQVEGRLLKWEPQTSTNSTVITYSILTAPYLVPGNKSILSPSNCAAMHAFSDIVAQSPKVPVEVARRELRAAFAAWEEVANVTFIETTDPRAADLIIGAQDIPEGKAFANLSYRSGRATAPVAKALGDATPRPVVHSDDKAANGATSGIDQAYVCLNPKTAWKVGFDGNLNVYDLRYTFTHEIGHAIGLDHPDRMDALMAYRYDEHVRMLQPSDIAAAQKLYGPRKLEE